MKKFLCILFSLFLIGCTQNEYEIKDDTIIAYVGKATETTTPKEAKIIGSDAFSSDMEHGINLESIRVTSNIDTIETNAFAFCSANTIYIDEGVKEIQDYAFMDSYIEEIWFPSSIEKVGVQIMETEEGLNCKIHVKKNSVMYNYFLKNMPYGNCELIVEEDLEMISKITVQEAKEIMEKEDVYIVDCRSQEEYDTGHIENAILIPMSKIKDSESIIPDKDKTILIYCRTGSRAGFAATQLADLGYKDIRNFGGVTTWPYKLVK